MAVKYSCPKCGRRFTEWGAERSGFRCPQDEWCPPDHEEAVELVQVGSVDDASKPKTSLKRASARKPIKVPKSFDAPGSPLPVDEDVADAENSAIGGDAEDFESDGDGVDVDADVDDDETDDEVDSDVEAEGESEKEKVDEE